MGRKCKYTQLQDKDWLCEKYLKERISTNQIAILIGASSANSVAFALKKFDIPIRNTSAARTIKNTSKLVINKDVIDGSLLGDGSLRMGGNHLDKKSKIRMPAFRKTNVKYDHLLYVAQQLLDDEAVQKIKEDTKRKCFSFCTRFSDDLLPFWKRWYPESNDFKKVVPHDLDLTPKVILNWFMDDGTTSARKRKTRQINMVFCSESFTKDDNEWLCNEFDIKYGIKPGIYYNGKGFGWRIRIPVKYIQNVYDVMGPCPVKSMEYKWK